MVEGGMLAERGMAADLGGLAPRETGAELSGLGVVPQAGGSLLPSVDLQKKTSKTMKVNPDTLCYFPSMTSQHACLAG